MKSDIANKPDYVFEVSWEVCNKVGGVHTVLATKASTMVDSFADSYITIGPDLRQSAWDLQEFIEHPTLFKSWQTQAQNDGLSFRIGRWDVPGSPVTILVDFTTYFASRNQIFKEYWEKYKLDSLSGDWDYIEPVMFGYAAGRIIESFYNFNCYAQDKAIAHFHHWMSACGVLYLKEHLPEVSTLYTVHGTSLAKAYADRGNMLFTNMEIINPGGLAKELNVASKHSLEYIAAQQADVLTCVGEPAVAECISILQREPDVVTYNGFQMPLEKGAIENKRASGRELLINVAESTLCSHVDEDVFIVGHSGRYQFHNKGIDMFIDMLDHINKDETVSQQFLAYILVPAHHTAPRYEVDARIHQKDFSAHKEQEYLTHVLQDEDNDPVLLKLKKTSLKNSSTDKVKIIFVPCYLNGNDGIFNKTYYDLLPGFDLMVFPSYYEPWGYTPAESVSFGVPAVTTSLTGFGAWVRKHQKDHSDCLYIAERTDISYEETMLAIAQYTIDIAAKKLEEKNLMHDKAFECSKIWSWDQLFKNYLTAYEKALQQTEKRREEVAARKKITEPLAVLKSHEKEPEWRKVFIKTYIPKNLLPLMDIAKNLWWSWNLEAQTLFESINKAGWEKMGHNPIALINSLSYDELIALEKDNAFIKRLNSVHEAFKSYMALKAQKDDTIAYFSMEFGLHDSLKIFSGGLGVLAGDYLKEASDSEKNITGIGLLYRYGYFNQKITAAGDQISEKIPQKFSDMPLLPVRDEKGAWLMISLPLPGRTLYAKIWKVQVGRIDLYLLDADIEENAPHDRSITHQLYGGNNEHRLKQEILLGVGGIKLLDKVNIKPIVYHCNEGHAAFSSIERLHQLVQNRKFSFDEALEIVRATTLFTTHTPVPAGHDFFSEELLRTYLPHYPERLNISWNSFINLGKMQDNDPVEEFSMSVLAVKTSQEVNGVSRIHGKVSRQMFNKIWKDFFPEELHIGHVTNGVHYPTWASPHWQKLHSRAFGKDFIHKQSDINYWKKIHEVKDTEIWSMVQKQREILIETIKQRIKQQMTTRQENPRLIFETIDAINHNALTIGFARRFATYKRAHLLFQDFNKLSRMVNDPDKPVMFIFAGKAHPADVMGQELIKKIVDISKQKDFLGKVIFIENYDMSLASKLIQGVDVWLNTPTRPMEASGTSGEKAVMNGVVNLSVLDGWWAEGFKPNAGWALKEEKTYPDQSVQDELDAEIIYNIIADEIIPLFYDRNQEDIPEKWLSYVKNTISEIAPHFTMNRMLNDYYEKFYSKLIERSALLFNDNLKKLKELAQWKRKMIRAWDSVVVKNIEIPDSTVEPLKLGDKFKANITIDLAEIDAEDIGIEVIFGKKEMDRVKEVIFKKELELIDKNHKKATYSCEIFISRSGVYDYAFRMYATNKLLPHRQDFNLVKWF